MNHNRVCMYLLVMLALGVAATTANAQFIESAMRGNTAVAAPGATTAWVQNPAGLAGGSDAPRSEFDLSPVRGWSHAVSAEFELSGDTDLFALNWGAVGVGRSTGIGAGYLDYSYAEEYGIGFGKSVSGGEMAWGLTVGRWDPDFTDSETVINVGVLGNIAIGAPEAYDARWGVVARDLTDEITRLWDAGIALQLRGGVTVAADIADVTDEWDRRFRAGASKRFGRTGQVEAGLGFDDGDLTLGAMWDLSRAAWKGGAWRVGAAWQEGDHGAKDSLLVGAVGTWGF